MIYFWHKGFKKCVNLVLHIFSLYIVGGLLLALEEGVSFWEVNLMWKTYLGVLMAYLITSVLMWGASVMEGKEGKALLNLKLTILFYLFSNSVIHGEIEKHCLHDGLCLRCVIYLGQINKTTSLNLSCTTSSYIPVNLILDSSTCACYDICGPNKRCLSISTSR